jgi:hypothetical protein
MVKDNTFVHIEAFMVNELKLKGNELFIYAIIYGFSQDDKSVYNGGLQYLADWTNSTKQGVIKVLKSLQQKGLLRKFETLKNNVKYCSYKALKCPDHSTLFNGGGKQSLMGYSTKFNGGGKQSLMEGGKQSLPNTIIRDTIDNTIEYTSAQPKSEKSSDLSPYDFLITQYLVLYAELYRDGSVKTEKPCYNEKQIRKQINELLKSYTVYDLYTVLTNAKKDRWLISTGFSISLVFAASQVQRLLNSTAPQYPQERQKKKVYTDADYLAGASDLDNTPF